MKVKIRSMEVKLKYSLRMFIIFENVMDRAFNGKLTTDFITLLYAAIRSSNKDCTVDLDEVIDLLDENTNILNDFVKWLSEQNVGNKTENSEKKN